MVNANLIIFLQAGGEFKQKRVGGGGIKAIIVFYNLFGFHCFKWVREQSQQI